MSSVFRVSVAEADLAAVALVVRGFSVSQAPSAVSDLGARIYADYCAQCHGEKGAGDGSAADQFPIAPANFQTQRPSAEASLHAVRNGVEGSPMASWKGRLSETEISAVASFVRGFYKERKP